MTDDAAWKGLGGSFGTPFVDIDTNGWAALSEVDPSDWRGHTDVPVEMDFLADE